jgi:hypothetical protein
VRVVPLLAAAAVIEGKRAKRKSIHIFGFLSSREAYRLQRLWSVASLKRRRQARVSVCLLHGKTKQKSGVEL